VAAEWPKWATKKNQFDGIPIAYELVPANADQRGAAKEV
jgi:hypothetical protein